MKKALFGMVAGVFALGACAGGASAAKFNFNFGVYDSYGAPYTHHYYSNYRCKNVFAGYRKYKVYKHSYGYGYGGYGGHYVWVKKPYYKRVCHHYGY